MYKRINLIKLVSAILLLVLFRFSVVAQADTAFWFAVPHITHSHAGRPIKLCISTYENPATVTVTKPAVGNQQVATFNVPANSSYSYQLVGGNQDNLSNIADFECNQNQTSNLGLYIHSTAKVNAYISVQSNNSEIYALKGDNALGTKFFIPMQFKYPNASLYSDARNSVEIIATEDNTVVKIVPSVSLYGGTAANQMIQVTLNKGQVYSFASSSQTAANHLCGTTIESDKPIVVDISDDSVTPNGSNQDLVADQIVPEELAGKEYVVIPSPSAANNTYNGSLSDYAFIFALEDNTDVEIKSTTTGSNVTTTSYTNLNRGAKKEYHFTNNNAIFISATKPIFVFQLIGAGNELGGTLLPHIYCTGSTEATYRPEPSVNNHAKHIFLTLICNPQYTSGFSINGQTNLISASDWKTVPGHTFQYCCKQINSLNTANSIRITNSLGKFHFGVIDYHQNGSTYDDCSISYFSSYNSGSSLAFNTDITHFSYCQGDTIFFAFDSLDIKDIKIYGPNDFYAENETDFFLANATAENSGIYSAVGHDSRNCLVEDFSDTITIEIYPSKLSEIEATVCQGASYAENGFNISEDKTTNPGVVLDTLELVSEEFGCDSIVVLKLTVSESITNEFSASSCDEYTWNGQKYTSSGDFVQNLQNDSGCDSTVTLHLTIIEPEVEISSSNQDFCDEEETILTATSEFDNFLWNTGETTPSIVVTKPGKYSVTAIDETGLCSASSIFEIPACEFQLFIPNAITPSLADGLNDYLHIPEFVHRYINDFEIRIFNRWGTQIFYSNDINFKWSGESGCQSCVYIYEIRYTNLDGKPFVLRGEITVL